MSQIYLGGEEFRRRAQVLVASRPASTDVPRLHRLPARPRIDEIIAATSREFGVEKSELRRRRHSQPRLALAYIARHEAALKLSEFSPALGIRGWAASQLATAAERLARDDARFQKSLHRIQRSLLKLTNPET